MLCLLLGRPGTQGALSSPALGERSNLAARNDPWPSLCFSNFSIAHFCKRTSCKLKTTVGPFNAFQCLSIPFIHQSCSFFIPLTLQAVNPVRILRRAPSWPSPAAQRSWTPRVSVSHENGMKHDETWNMNMTCMTHMTL